tara:strand:- start:66 stop:239 length:174 start_codon:yes stop_codon:yes gene_type:complete
MGDLKSEYGALVNEGRGFFTFGREYMRISFSFAPIVSELIAWLCAKSSPYSTGRYEE